MVIYIWGRLTCRLWVFQLHYQCLVIYLNLRDRIVHLILFLIAIVFRCLLWLLSADVERVLHCQLSKLCPQISQLAVCGTVYTNVHIWLLLGKQIPNTKSLLIPGDMEQHIQTTCSLLWSTMTRALMFSIRWASVAVMPLNAFVHTYSIYFGVSCRPWILFSLLSPNDVGEKLFFHVLQILRLSSPRMPPLK